MDSCRTHYRRFSPENPTWALLCALVALGASWAYCADVKPPDAAAISGLISDLSADDAQARQTAADKLVALGAAARPAVLAAAHSDDPETRQQAVEVLLKLPWSIPDDPRLVRAILDQYTHYSLAPLLAGPNGPVVENPPQEPEQYRIDAVAALAGLPDSQGLKPLVRLACQEPSAKVRWAIVHAVRTNDDGSHLAPLRQITVPADDAPLSALCGLAWLGADEGKAAPLLRQAVNLQLRQHDDDGGELDFVIQCLTDLEETAGHFDAAADLLRTELKREPPTDRNGVPEPLPRLLALQADHGPLKQLAGDIKMADGYADSPEVLYSVARIEALQGQAKQAAADRALAFKASSTSPLSRFYTAKFLSDRGWDDEASAELKAYLAMPQGDDQNDVEASRANAHFQLAGIAARHGDDQTAADEKKDAMVMLGGETNQNLVKSDGRGYTWSTTEDDIWAEIHWRYLRAAMARKDDAQVEPHLKELIRLNNSNEDIAIDVVPILRARHGEAAARQYYATAYAAAKARLAADPNNPALMNGVAWLEAKCDENLDDALAMATAAAKASPNSAAVIDTLAEVNYHLGKFPQAVELEQRALKLQPGDKFMMGQLAKFKAGKK